MTDEQWNRIAEEWKDIFGSDLDSRFRSGCSTIANENDVNLDTCSIETLLAIANQAKIEAYK